MQPFMKGLSLNRSFYHEAVAPLLAEGFPGLVYSAARIGAGSDVLGFDTEMSMDHDWGPRLEIFLSEEDYVKRREAIHRYLSARLPHCFRGFPVSFTTPNPSDNGTQIMDYAFQSGPVNHRVSIHTLKSFLTERLGIPLWDALEPQDWLSFSEQSLLEVIAGEVYYDGLGELGRARQALDYYPRDVWLFRLASQWQRLSEEEAFVGRCGEVGDDFGSRLVTARLVRDLTKLCFLLERKYAPYGKWLGTAFAGLKCHCKIEPPLRAALRADTWREREGALTEAASLAGQLQNALEIAPSLDTGARQFHNRPFLVIDASRFAEAVRFQISDGWIRGLPLSGGVDQFCDCVGITTDAEKSRSLRCLYTTR